MRRDAWRSLWRAGLGLALLVLLLPPAADDALVAQAPRTHRNTEALRFSDLREVPADRTLLTETVREAWYFVSPWSDRQSALEPGRQSTGGGRYRYRSPFAILDKKSGRWRNAAISRL